MPAAFKGYTVSMASPFLGFWFKVQSLKFYGFAVSKFNVISRSMS